ncbi:MAG: 4-alpha-glucanotransferase [Acidobacteria bacterium]|nr:4-alpha-glucanotransferase [Acidobacteriota bacterium]
MPTADCRLRTAGPVRLSGVLVPLFSIPSTRSWGIGEIGDLTPFASWLRAAGFQLIQVLPLNEMAAGGQSPYSAMSAMAIDPIFISVAQLEDFRALGGAAAMGAAWQDQLAAARAAGAVDYRLVRSVKMTALRAAFERFRAVDLARDTCRAGRFRRWCVAGGWWLDDYALFRAVHANEDERSWMEWPALMRAREPGAIRAARADLDGEILYRQYLQWIANEQWQAARRTVAGMAVFGDLPFMVDADSADVWTRQHQFRLDASVGAPPDAFSELGQRWGLPPYEWDVCATTGYEWLALRARRAAELYDGYRIDHLVGFYRTYVIPNGRLKGHFSPAEPPAQLELGETLLRIFGATGAQIIAEDLGTVPGFVRESLARMGVPGCRVLRWEREWDLPARPFRDPSAYPPSSVAASGTHDTDTLAVWWDGMDDEERAAVGGIPGLQRLLPEGLDVAHAPFSPAILDALLTLLYASGSNLLILPVQDLFGWRDRINVPALVSDHNWTWRLPWPSDEIRDQPEAAERAATLGRWARAHGRVK